MPRNRAVWIAIGIVLGLTVGLGAQPFLQAVLLHVGTPSAPVALSATNGALHVTCQ